MITIAIEIKKIEEKFILRDKDLVSVTESGNITKIQYMSKRNNTSPVTILKGMQEYIDNRTGEIKPIVHHVTRADQVISLKRTFRNIADTINTNVTDIKKVKWITLTYAENMLDTKKLYKDFQNFNDKFKYFCDKKGYGHTEYIVVMEPQGRGAWHAHLIYIFEDLIKAPFIDNNTEFQPLWGHGYTKIKNLKFIDNIGVYLTAYLGDMEVHEATNNGIDVSRYDCKLADLTDEETGKKVSKCYIKGARLPLYPAKFNMMRCSRGIKKANKYLSSYEMVKNKVSVETLTFEKTLSIIDEEKNFETLIHTKYYNKLRKIVID